MSRPDYVVQQKLGALTQTVTLLFFVPPAQKPLVRDVLKAVNPHALFTRLNLFLLCPFLLRGVGLLAEDPFGMLAVTF